MKIILKPSGIITIEVPHLLKLIKNIEFDTIYHEHYSYFSLKVLKDIFEKLMKKKYLGEPNLFIIKKSRILEF